MLRRGGRRTKLRDQTIVITGASSGIGLATARMAARRGARVVLAARNEADLRSATAEILSSGGRAMFVVADVANAAEVDGIADAAIREFGGFDTWVNNAGISVYGKLDDVPLEDKRRVFDVNFWGVVHGCRSAVKHFRDRGGGVLINIGSIVSDVAIPMQGIYSASKHAVRGYTNALRIELEHDRVPVAVTLIKPGSIDTPYLQHARNYMDAAPTLPPPIYAPEVVARAILRCAERPLREVTVGGGGRVMSALANTAPRLADRYMKRFLVEGQKDRNAGRRRQDSLYEPSRDGRASGPYQGYVMQSSAYTSGVTSGAFRAMAWIAAATALAAGARRWASPPVAQ